MDWTARVASSQRERFFFLPSHPHQLRRLSVLPFIVYWGSFLGDRVAAV
jgi:hypothetical protein